MAIFERKEGAIIAFLDLLWGEHFSPFAIDRRQLEFVRYKAWQVWLGLFWAGALLLLVLESKIM